MDNINYKKFTIIFIIGVILTLGLNISFIFSVLYMIKSLFFI